MQLSNVPGKLVLPFANAGGKNTIPVDSQIGITAGAASLVDGFPPLTRTPIAAGGVPPSGLDMNGILYEMSAIIRWANAGGGYPYDGAFATDINVGGYPKGARVMRSDGLGYWFNTTDNNTTDPEAAGTAPALAGWVPDYTTGAAAVTMTSANVTLTAVQYGKPLIVITGTLTGNLNLVFPSIVGEWSVLNGTTGAYTITAKTAAGTGVLLAQGSITTIVGDGVNIYSREADFSNMSDMTKGVALIGGAGRVVNSIAALRTLPKTGSPFAFVTTYYAGGIIGHGGGAYQYDSADTTSTDNGGSVIVTADGGRWKLAQSGRYSIEQFGAKLDGDGAGGGTDISAAIQATHNAIVATGKAGVILMPAGTGRCDSGLTIDASVVRIDAEGTLLDFTNLSSSGTAITVLGGTLSYAGNPFYNAVNVINGLKLYGGTWGGSGTKCGVNYNGTTQTASGAHSGMRDCEIWGFATGLQISQNSYILSFDHIEIFGCGTCVNEPTADNAGERIVFNNCAFYNSTNGFNLQNAIASTFLNHCSIDGMSAFYFRIEAGHLSVTDCHIEGTFSGTNPSARMFWNANNQYPSYAYVTWIGNHVLVKKTAGTVRANPVFAFDGQIDFVMNGGYVYANDTPDTAAAVFSGTGVGSVYVTGTFVDYGSNTLNAITGQSYAFDLANSLDANRNYGNVSAPTIQATTGQVRSDTGIFSGNTKTTTLVALSTYYSLSLGTASGLLVCRDGSLGGTAVFACDPSSGVVAIQNGITGLTCAYDSSALSLQITSGATGRQIRWAFLKVQG